MQPKTALIVGTGYLGRRVARRWVAAGIHVHGTTRSQTKADELRAENIIPVIWDVNQEHGSLPPVQTVLYCVGFDRSAGQSRTDVYVNGLRNTLAHLPKPGRLIYISSTGVYGDHAGAWVDETTPPQPLDDGGSACLAAEQALTDFAKRESWNAIILRLVGIYGPGRRIGADRLRAGETISGNPDTFLNLIHVEDAASVVDAAIQRGKPGQTYLVSDGNPPTRREFYTYLAKLLDAPTPRFDPASASRHRGDRRVSNQKMRTDLLPILKFPNYQTGLQTT